MMNAFEAAMAFFKTVQEFKDHCCTLLDILANMKGIAIKLSGTTLKESWNTAVRREYGIDFL